MMEKQKNIPKLRFYGFSEAWDKKKLGEIATNKSEKYNPEKENEFVQCIELEHISSETSELLGYTNGSNLGSIKNRFNKGEVLFGKLRPYLKKYLLAPFDGVCSSEIWVLKGISISNEFLFRVVQTNKFIDLANQSSGSKMPRADWSVVETGVFSYPGISEQYKIASFFFTIDQKIRSLKKKKALLEEYKKGVIQKIFSQEIRFKEDEGQDYPEWNQSLLGDLCEVSMCKRIFAEETNESGEIPFYKIGTLGGAPDAFISRKKFEEYKQKYKFPLKGEVLITCSGTIGKCIPFDGRDAYFQDSNIVWLDNKSSSIENSLLYYIVSNVDWGKINSTTIKRIYGEDLRKLIIHYPQNKNEQIKISNFLTSLDEKIEKTGSQISGTESWKKGLLQQMFC